MARGNPNWVRGRRQEQVGRAKTIPLMGEQPVLRAAISERPPETPNPMAAAAEPVSLPHGWEQRVPKTTESTAVRRVVEADIDEMMEWGLPRFQQRYPRCTADSVRPMLLMALRSNKMAFFRTPLACGLFVAELTPWEPELTVQDVFVVAKAREKGEEDNPSPPPLYAGRLQAANIYKAALRWAIEIGAVAYHFGVSTGVDLDPLAAEVGYDVRNVGYTKFITPEMREAQRAA